MNQAISINKYMPAALLFFFCNSFLLPHGLLYTTLLTPLLIIWLYRFPSFRLIKYFFLVMLPFALIHFKNGVDPYYYLKSTALLFSVYIFVISFYQFLKENRSIRAIYRNIMTINALFVLFALAALFIPVIADVLWSRSEITQGASGIKRLQLLTYEPSYYSTLLVPIALYYYIKILLRKIEHPFLILLMMTVPLLLSLSFGVILGLVISLFLTILTDFKRFFPGKYVPLYVLVGTLLLVTAFIVCWFLFPDSIFFVRFRNVFAGRDSSFRGRTVDSFELGWHYASLKSILFGCGPGQGKVIGLEFFKEYYNHDKFTMEDVSIPNVLGDTLSAFGIVGLAIRMIAEIVLFFKTKVYSNYYRLNLFLYMFIYQFTGSFLTNIAEYIIWSLAFYGDAFTEFDRPLKLRNNRSVNTIS